MSSYPHDTTSGCVSDNRDDLITSLEKSIRDLQKWNDNNLVKSNPDKCHLVVSSFKKINMQIGDFKIGISTCGDFKIETNTCEKLLGVHFYSRLTFDYYVSGLFK